MSLNGLYLNGAICGYYCPCCRLASRICIDVNKAAALSQKERRLEELELMLLRFEDLESMLQSFVKRVRFLHAFDPAPLSESFVGDVDFVGSDQVPVSAHRFIMAGKSTVFQRMFRCDMKEKVSGTVVVYDASSAVLKSMVNFCYTAEIEFTEDAPAEEMLKISHKYDIGDLKEECEEELSKGVNGNNFCERLKLAHMYDAKKLDAALVKYFQENFTDMYKQVAESLCREPI
ncbi:hypothetical protein R1sor_000606 [Riccia sorocarpa]|uniref:BTB domain-containing protein n=1 Tax=Riccia sorocarpa TaxID=122646 RepID=A0ABD3GXK7_9MARC